MAALPYMPLYVADYLADAAHLSTVGHGAYLLLIMTYWQRGEALPDDDRKLARIARMTDAEWRDVREDMAEFFSVEGGRWSHKRIDRELASVRAKSEQARDAGRASAERRGNARSTPVQRPSNDTDTETYPETEKIVVLKNNPKPLTSAAPATFPRDGSIEFTRWAELARQHAPARDVDAVASAFRQWASGLDPPLSLEFSGIEGRFVKFCQTYHRKRRA